MIKIKNLKKNFKNNFWEINIFKDLNMDVKTWDFISIVWPSWSWKSTLLNMISMIDNDYFWEILIDDIVISKLTDDQKTQFRWQNISYIFQNFKLIDNLTVQENIDLVVDINNLERNFSTDEILKKVWLYDKKDNYVFNLSWWESQRVAIARAFVWKTKILLADEPTWALDYKNKKNIMDLVLGLHKEIQNTIIMITHDEDVAKMALKKFKIQDGDLVEI